MLFCFGLGMAVLFFVPETIFTFFFVIGCLILGVLSNGMQLAGLGIYIQYIVKGIILMLSIGYDTLQKQAKVKKVTSVKAAA